MTIANSLIEKLIQNGMSETQAKEVLEVSNPSLNELIDDYSLDLNQSASSYPIVIINILFASIKPIALKWIEDNKPQAWFKPMFQ